MAMMMGCHLYWVCFLIQHEPLGLAQQHQECAQHGDSQGNCMLAKQPLDSRECPWVTFLIQFTRHGLFRAVRLAFTWSLPPCLSLPFRGSPPLSGAVPLEHA